MTSQVCCLIRTLKGQIDTLEDALEECGETSAALAPPAPVLLAVVSAKGNNTFTTAAIDTTGAKFIVIAVARYQQPSISDSYGNRWGYYGDSTSAIGGWSTLYACPNPKTGPNHTFTMTGTAVDGCMNVAAFSWTGDFQLQTESSSSGLSIALPAITPTSKRTLLIALVANYGSDIVSISGGFKMIAESAYVTGSISAGALAYKLTEEMTAQAPAWTLAGTSAGSTAVLASFDAVIPSKSPSLEVGAWEHWLFQLPAGTIPAATPIPGKYQLHNGTPVAPVISTGKSVIMQAGLPGVINGINLGYPNNTGDWTVCAVVKAPKQIGGSYTYLVGTGSFQGGGGALAGQAHNSLGYLSIFEPGISNKIIQFSSVNILPDEWCFVVLRRTANIYSGTVNEAPFATHTTAAVATANNIALGNIFDSTAADAGLAGPVEVAEAIIFPSSLTNQQVLDVYNRSKLRMAAIGIQIAGGLPNLPSALLLASTSKGLSAGGGHTDPIDTTGAELIVLNLAYYDGGTLTDVEDSQGNTYLPLSAHIDPATGATQQLWYCENPATGTAHQVQINGATIFASIQVAAFGGADIISVNPLDQQAGGIGSGLSINVGPIGQSTPLSLVIAGLAFSDTQPTPPATDGGLDLIGAVPYIFGQHFGSAMAFKTSDTVIAHAVQWDFTVPMSGTAASIATFKLNDS